MGGGGAVGGGGGGGPASLGLNLLGRLKLNSDVAIQFEDHGQLLKAFRALSGHAMAQVRQLAL